MTFCLRRKCFQNDSELFGRTIRVNLAKPQRIKEGSTRPVWSDDTWLQQHAGETIGRKVDEPSEETDNDVSCNIFVFKTILFYQ